jgi:predicted AlkP superfamily phosphohydrolase/phosphomutase
MNGCRTLVLGLDGATFDVIDPLVARGRMPALAALMRDGVRAPLRSTCPPVSAPAWVTFLTGRHPGKHGVFNFQNVDVRRYAGFTETLVNSSYFRGTTLLDHLGRAGGVRTLSYRVPMTYPPWDLPNGVLVSGPPLPDRRRAYARPAAVEAEIGAVSPLSHDEQEAAKRAHDVARMDGCNRFELGVFERTATRYLGGGYDLVIAFTGIPDTLHHYFWGFHDPTSPVHDPGAPEPLRTIVARAYEDIDAAIGRLVRRAGRETAVIVLSDHGGGPAPVRQVNFNAFLAAAGHLTAAAGRRREVAAGVRRLVDRARQDLPGRTWLKRHLPGGVRRRLRGFRNATAAIDWEHTRAYAVPIHYPITGICVNLAGRQAKGIVPAGAPYEHLRDELLTSLATLRDPRTGAALVAGAWRREDVFTGPYVEQAPDLIVETTAGHHGGVDVDELVQDVPLATLRRLSGSHTRDGILVAAGGPFRRGAVLERAGLADVLPTAVHVLGAPLPEDLDGRVLEEALEPAWVAAHPVRVAARDGEAAGREALPADDEGEMRKFLQGLGYVE